jgi:hypothetical protein
MGAGVHLAQVRQQREEERWRAVGYQAIDERINKLRSHKTIKYRIGIAKEIEVVAC